MPEVILPCPHCRTDRYLSVQSFKALKFMLFRVICNGCGVSGPAGDTRKSAIEAHNTIPRSLTWTNEPPKVAGKYWWRPFSKKIGRIRDIFVRNGEVGFLDRNNRFIKDIDDGEWAGPIAPPIEE